MSRWQFFFYKSSLKQLSFSRPLGLGCFIFIEGDNISHLKTKKIRRGWIVVNTKTGRHSHFRSEYGCYLIKKFIRKNIFPDNPYLQESYRRLTESKKDYKQRYININKGI